MRITGQLLKKYTLSSLEEAEYIELSGKDIVAIERLGPCCKLETLILCGNSIDALRNVDCCRQLWKVDLSGNKVKSLAGLSRFPVLGTLVLAYNELDWEEVRRLSYLRLLSLSLLGNSKIDSDPHYREHVVDLLPHLWMLDGRMITAEERRMVAQFFAQSESSSHPVWRKRMEGAFTPSNMKNLLVTGVFGEKTTHLMSRFPVSYVHNIEMDRRQLSYLAYTIEEEMKQEYDHMCRRNNLARSSPSFEVPEVVRLMEHRCREVEQCNMLLLLLLASLEFNLPPDVMKATLETAKLTKISVVNCVGMLTLPAHMTLGVASLLISAAAVDREEKKEGGLYDQLYCSLCHAMERCQRKVLASRTNRPEAKMRKVSIAEQEINSHLRCLLASEVVHLMCLVPLFFESLETNKGLMEMIAVATRNPNVADVIGSIAWKVQAKGGDVWEVYHDIASYLLQSTSENVPGKKRHRHHVHIHRQSSPIHRTTSQLLQATQPKPHSRAMRALSAGAISRRMRARSGARSALTGRSLREPELGDLVMVNPEQVARIVALPETHVAVLQLNPQSSSVVSSPPDSYFYTDTHGLVWDRQLGCWTKDNLAAELSTSRLTPSPDPLSSSAFLSTHTGTSIISLEGSYITRAATPDPHPRPHSQMSFLSDDLQTIPSEDELIEEEEEESGSPPGPSPPQQTPMRVDISDRHTPIKTMASTSSTSLRQGQIEEARVEHQKHVLHQYNVSQDNPEGKNPQGTTTLVSSHNQLLPVTSNQELFMVPTPQVHLLDTWETSKSVPDVSHTKSHSCQQSESAKQLSKMRSVMPTTSSQMTSPLHTAPPSTTSALSLKSATSVSASSPQPVVYNAWGAVKPNVPTKHTALTSSRLMTRRQPKQPPTSSKSASGGRIDLPKWKGANTTVVLQQEPKSPYHSTAPPHLRAYGTHVQLNIGKYHFQQKQSSRAPSRRQLGNVRSLYIGGASTG